MFGLGPYNFLLGERKDRDEPWGYSSRRPQQQTAGVPATLFFIENEGQQFGDIFNFHM
jgi:hypothetical protein